MALCSLLLLCVSLGPAQGERINTLATKVRDCLLCGMAEGVGYLTVKVRMACISFAQKGASPQGLIHHQMVSGS